MRSSRKQSSREAQSEFSKLRTQYHSLHAHEREEVTVPEPQRLDVFAAELHRLVVDAALADPAADLPFEQIRRRK